MKMDDRIREFIEKDSGLPFQAWPDEGIQVCVSEARTDKPKNRLLVQRVIGKNGVLITGIPRIVKAMKSYAESMTGYELFSPLGIAEIKRSLSQEDTVSLEEHYGFQYFLTDLECFRPVKSQHKVIALKKNDIPSVQYDLRMGERRSFETEDFIWAFACYHKGENVPSTMLREYGSKCVSVAVIIWREDDIAHIALGTEESFRGQGYALAAASTAVQWVLDQGAIVWQGVYSDNIPSIRIARRLGFTLVYSSFGA